MYATNEVESNNNYNNINNYKQSEGVNEGEISNGNRKRYGVREVPSIVRSMMKVLKVLDVLNVLNVLNVLQ